MPESTLSSQSGTMNLATDSPSYSEDQDRKAETAFCFKKFDILKNVMLFVKAPETFPFDLRCKMEV
jgi:hypothetical protein